MIEQIAEGKKIKGGGEEEVELRMDCNAFNRCLPKPKTHHSFHRSSN